jgi:predicted DCC family thiol-disulfide oxidoreductase YuxK
METGKKVTLIFDGDCGFCTSSANFAVARSKYPITAVPWQRANLADFGLTPEMASSRVYVAVTGMGQPSDVSVFGGHKAFAKLFKIQPNLFAKLVGALMITPPISWIAAAGYVFVAKYRHKLPGGTPACKLP